MKCAACGAGMRALRCLILLLAALFLGVSTGCYSPGRSSVSADFAPVTETERANFGRMALMLPDRGPAFVFHYPRNQSEAIVHNTAETWDTMDSDDGIGDFLAGLAISGTVGVVSGAIAGVPQHRIEEAERQMRQVLKQHPIANSLSNRIQTSLIEQGRPPLPVVPPDLTAQLCETPLESRDYRALSVLGFDSVMEVGVTHLGFRPSEGGNSPFAMEAEVYVEVTHTTDRAVLFRSPIYYHGHQHRYMCWASEDARRFRSDIRRIGRMIGQGVVDQVIVPARASAELK